MSKRLGIKCKLYLNVNTYESPTWNNVDRVSDATLNIQWEEGDAKSRESIISTFEPTMGTLDCSGKIRVDGDDGNYVAIRNAFAGKVALDLLILDGEHDEDDSEGVRGDFKVFNFSRDESMGNVIFRDFTLKPCIPTAGRVAVRHVVVAGGIPVYSDFGG